MERKLGAAESSGDQLKMLWTRDRRESEDAGFGFGACCAGDRVDTRRVLKAYVLIGLFFNPGRYCR